MKKPVLALLLLFAALSSIAQKSNNGFIENKGQIVDQEGNPNTQVLYLLNRPGLNVQLKKNSFSYDTWTVDLNKRQSTAIERQKYSNQPQELQDILTYPVYNFHRVDIELVNANPSPEIIAESPSKDVLNYYLSGSEAKGIRHYSKVIYRNIYPYIDLEFFIKDNSQIGDAEYQFVVHPGGDVKDIVLKYDGSYGTKLSDGKILIDVSNGSLTEEIPMSYILGDRTPVTVKYSPAGKDCYGFVAGNYPKYSTLIIDPWPQLMWGTYYGGNQYEKELGVVTDALENVYVCGQTYSTANIATAGAHQVTKNSGYDGFIAKLDGFGQRVWATYYGGPLHDYIHDITLDAVGNVYVCGSTFSTSAIATAGAHQTAISGGEEAFLVKFDNNGVRQWGTYYGGTAYDKFTMLKVAPSGNIYAGGETGSANNIATAGSYKPTISSTWTDAFVVKFDPAGVRDWGTYFGGDSAEFVRDGLIIDVLENVYITGKTKSINGISSPGAYQPASGSSGNDYDAFVAKLTTSGNMVWSTYYGGTASDEGFDLSLNSTGDLYVVGWTFSNNNISTSGSFQEIYGGATDAFIAKFNSNGNCVRGSYFGGISDDMINAIQVDANGELVLSGSTKGTTGLATPYVHQSSYMGVEDMLLIKFDSLLQRSWCTYFGGTNAENSWDVCVTTSGYYYVCGDAKSLTLVATSGVHQSTYGGGTQDGYIARFAECSLVTADSHIMPSCFGDSNGSAIVTPDFGFSPYGYLWGDGQTNDTASGLAAGTYYVTIGDSRGCLWKDTVDVLQPALLTTILTGNDALCFGGSEGNVTANPAGGTPAYSYLWDSGCIEQTCDSLPAGTYIVTVTDLNNCTVSEQVTIGQPTIISVTVNTTDANCHGGSDGIAQAVVTGGTPNPDYGYLWSNNETTPDIIGLSAGEYYVTVNDGNSCTMVDTFLIGQPDTLLMSFTEIPASCFGYNDGSLDVAVTGGIIPYSYLWENGDTLTMADSLAAGTHYVTVTDSHNCVVNGQFDVTQPTLLTSVFDNVYNVSCHAFSDGYASALPSGGTPSYFFNWSSGSDSSEAGSLIAGDYYLTVTDAHNCFFIDTVSITEPDTIAVSFTNTSNLCYGDSTGSSNVLVSGGSLPFLIVWSSGDTGTVAGSLTAGTYTLTVVDDHSCIFEASTQVVQPDSIEIIFTADSVACNGGTDGSASAITIGGTNPFTYLWGTGSFNDTIFNLTAGTYPLTVTDANSCTAVDAIVISEPSPIRLFVNYYNLTCYQSNDGAADASAIGGVPPYQFLWSTGHVGTVIDSLPAGNYSVTVFDSHGCTESLTFILTEPDLLVSSGYTVDVICYGDPSGIGGVSTIGGTEPYSYLWNNGYTQVADSTIASGTYIITTTDANGCSDTDTITVVQPDDLIIGMTYQNVLCYNHANGWAASAVTGGILPYDYQWSSGDTTSSVTGLVPNTYNLIVTDNNLCTETYSVTITQPDSLMFISSTQNISCYEFDDGSVIGSVTGGTLPYNVSFTDTAGSQLPFTDLAAGIYYLYVTDSNSCVLADTFTISQPDTLLPVADFGIAPYDNYGYVDLSVSGGTEPYYYYWSNNYNSQDLTHLIGGTYTVTITDDHGCTSVLSAIIDLSLTIPDVITPNNDGYNDNFEILNLEAYTTIDISVYNRWGILLYNFNGSTQEYNNGNRFDGYFEGKPLPMGSYTYIIILNTEGSYTGAVLVKY